ncbi:FtsK/SpoIIIE domain-containing protein [Arthrobacter sp. SLBN-112]|uniref:FtsK/SpoIIIE domain-containing protein n=1 Tax=Arthrobacter sp. SLBN-112 TaxID=2768452 RepID=UPI0027B42B52|nr:FtsK/SpoIIIE domain-containing protein [Arthrobacter sp. SLBN-112]MDQ0800622.1 S-DNA-T family DNA segregation ATPase FtsK/SpoIIIE [Arthrobacter sp. SLBN-112]
MTVHCTLVGGPGSARLGPPLELSIVAAPGTAGAEINEQLSKKFGTGAVTVEGQDLCSLVSGIPPLVDAAILVDGGASPSSQRPRRSSAVSTEAPLALAIHSGAAAGTVVPIRRGSYTIGRSGTRIVIQDPELSREHARIVVTDTDIILIDLDSANGTYVDGERIRNAVISTDSGIRCGQSTMSLVFSDLPERVLSDAGRSVAEPIVVSGRAEPGNRVLLLLAAVLPLAIGVGLAVFTGMWMFLAFSAASALSVLVPIIGGWRQRQQLSAAVKTAVREDRERRRRCAPSLAVVALAAHRGTQTPVPGSASDGVWLRLGEMEQEANVRVEPADAVRTIPWAGRVPVLLDPRRPLTVVGGSSAGVDGAIRSLLMQLAGYPLAVTTGVVIHGQPENLPLAARYLPGVTLTGTTDAGLRVIGGGGPSGSERTVLFIRSAGPATAGDLEVRAAALERGWQVLHFLPEETASPAADVFLSERRSVMLQDHGETLFVADLVPDEVFTALCRRLAKAPKQADGPVRSIPDTCGLGDVLPLTVAETARRWESNAARDGLPVPLGLGVAGTKTVDLQADGPHLLVAGTTGSGKSELLRTLTFALALSYPPERINFYFFDFKGGSGLGPLSGLVHCVGLQTDLSTSEMERTLVSLRAEVRLREEHLSAAAVPDIAAYRSSPMAEDFVLPHLVIIIDEFRMLVEDAPEVLRELLRIASIGRSLGIHLVMATQRPQGALTADIRANVTSSIALRVQSEMESMDIVNSKAAAAIGVDAPGRAFLARGTEPAEEFQAACLASQSEDPPRDTVVVQPTAVYLASREATDLTQAGPAPTPAKAAAPLVALVESLCVAQAKRVPRRPVAPPLPEYLEEPAGDLSAPGSAVAGPMSGGPGDDEGTVDLGLMDLPHKQKAATLTWSRVNHGHAAFIGSSTSGATAGLELTARRLLASPSEAHFYFLDSTGSLLPFAQVSRVGAHAGVHELRRGVRILERLTRELSRRLSRPAAGEVPLVLIVSGWGSWVSALRSGPLAWAEDLVQDLVRDGSRAGITMLLSGERELVTARFYGSIPNRFYFPSGSTEESRAAWPRMPSIPAVAGRAVVFGPAADGGPAVCQFYRQPFVGPGQPCAGRSAYLPASSPPFRVEPLPAKITTGEVAARAGGTPSGTAGSRTDPRNGQPGAARASAASGQARAVLLGVAGDELEATALRIPPSGVVAVLGAPESGKSNVLSAMKRLNPDKKWCSSPPPHEAEGDFWKDVLQQAEAGALPPETLLLVDDIDLLDPPAVKDLGHLNALGYSLVVTAGYGPVLPQRVPLILNARAAGLGLLLCPRSMADGDLFGVRFEVEANPPPGRGILISAGRSCPLQVGWAGAAG